MQERPGGHRTPLFRPAAVARSAPRPPALFSTPNHSPGPAKTASTATPTTPSNLLALARSHPPHLFPRPSPAPAAPESEAARTASRGGGQTGRGQQDFPGAARSACQQLPGSTWSSSGATAWLGIQRIEESHGGMGIRFSREKEGITGRSSRILGLRKENSRGESIIEKLTVEKDAALNVSLRAFEVIDSAKTKAEAGLLWRRLLHRHPRLRRLRHPRGEFLHPPRNCNRITDLQINANLIICEQHRIGLCRFRRQQGQRNGDKDGTGRDKAMKGVPRDLLLMAYLATRE